MKLIHIRQRICDILLCAGLAAVTAGLIIFPSQMVGAAREGVELCASVIIPSLFPFFVISSLTVELGIADALGRVCAGVMRPLFNVGGSCASALVLGFVGGYPVGARTVINLYKNGRCSKAEAERMLAFCNNSGPAFIFGVVGAGIFESGRVGLLLYLAHVAASIIVGLIFRNWGPRSVSVAAPRGTRRKVPFSEAFVGSVGSAVSSSLGICGFVIFFTVLIRLLFLSGVLRAFAGVLGGAFGFIGLDAEWAEKLLCGAIELTSGVWTLHGAGAIPAFIAMAAFMLGWAGLSVHCQVLSFMGSTGLSVKTYIIGKFLHGLISAALVLALTAFMPAELPVASFLAARVHSIAELRFASALRSSSLLAAGVMVIFTLISIIFAKKGGKSRRGEL